MEPSIKTIQPKPANRLIRSINLAMAVLLVVGAGTIYWVAWRPLPQTSGTVRLPISSAATIMRDALGVPHIQAGSEADALFLQGYVTAQERMFQMDGLRRIAAGDLAEIAGARALPGDRETRRLRMRRLAEAALLSAPPGDRAVLAAYARGVNEFLRTHRGRLPLEFRLAGYDPRPWSAVDSILVVLYMYRTLTTTWRNDVMKRDLLAGGDPDKVNFLLPVRAGTEPYPGSNAWVIAGARTTSGKPLLSNDPHLEWSIPGVWFQVQLRGPGLNVEGVSLPGLPGVVIGHNDRIAWGMTNLQFDLQDLYLEDLDERTGRYTFAGHPEQARLEREIIPIEGGSAEEMAVWVTRHGPVIMADGKAAVALRWTAAEPGTLQFPMLDLDKARNWQEFTAALKRYAGPPQNFVYADVDGNIGYHVGGLLPVRRGFAGDVPLDGSSGKFEWQGFIPFDQLPASYNPPSGMIVTANQNPFPPDYAYTVSGNFSPPYRANQIRALLSARRRWRPADMLAVQKDVYSAFSRFLARQIVAACGHKNASGPEVAEALALLRAWNGQMDKDESAPLIVTLAFERLRRAVAERASPKKGQDYTFPMETAAIEKLLRERPAGWFPDYDAVLVRAFRDGLDDGRNLQGRNPAVWKYGRYMLLTIAHPIGHRLPLVSGYFDIGPAPMSGSRTTVKQTTRRLGPSMRMTVDLADLDRSLMNLDIGESGHVLSSHYKDQWTNYYYGRSYPMQFHKVEAREVLHAIPEPH